MPIKLPGNHQLVNKIVIFSNVDPISGTGNNKTPPISKNNCNINKDPTDGLSDFELSTSM